MRLSAGLFSVLLGLGLYLPALGEDGPQGADPEAFKRKLLEKYDANGDGRLTGEEEIKAREEIAKTIGPAAGPAGAAFEEFQKKFDRDGDGKLNPQERAAALSAFQKMRGNGARGPAIGGVPGAGVPGGLPPGIGGSAPGKPGKPRGREAMIKRFDKDGDGKLSEFEKEEAQKILKAKKGKSDEGGDDKMAELLEKFDKDGDGKLSDEEKAAARKELGAKKGERKKKPE